MFRIDEIINLLHKAECRAIDFDNVAETKTTIFRGDEWWELSIEYGDGCSYRYDFDSIAEVMRHLDSMVIGVMIAKGMEV